MGAGRGKNGENIRKIKSSKYPYLPIGIWTNEAKLITFASKYPVTLRVNRAFFCLLNSNTLVLEAVVLHYIQTYPFT